MSWDYRVIRRDGTLAIHEVYYNSNGTIHAYTADPVPVLCLYEESLDDVLNMMRAALDKPVLTDADLPGA